jgi:ATP-dependent 26S proteasome regulatory subunit
VCGIKESDTGLAPPSRWDLVSDKQMMQEEQPLQVARCTKIINPGTDEAKYVINVKQIAKFVVGLGDKVRAGQQLIWTRGQQKQRQTQQSKHLQHLQQQRALVWQRCVCRVLYTMLLQQCW